MPQRLTPTRTAFINQPQHDTVANFSGWKPSYIDEGYAICKDLALGASAQLVTNEVMGNPNFRMDSVSARELVIAAEDNPC